MTQILAFSRRSETEGMPVHVHHVFKDALNLPRSTIPKSIEIRQDVDPDAGAILAESSQIHQEEPRAPRSQ